MSDEIVEALARAGSDDGRSLGFSADDIVRVGRIRRRRRRVYGGAATVLSAVVAIVALALLVQSGRGQSLGEPATVPLDRGPMSAAEVWDAVGHACPGGPGELDTIYARHVDSSGGTAPAVLATGQRRDGVVYTCGTDWAARGEGPVLRMPDRAHPIVPIAIEPGTMSLESAWGSESGFFRVADSVASVETRVGSPGGSEPWRVSVPYDGVVFWSAWADEGAFDDDDEVWLQWRAFDTDGHRIAPALLPFQPELIDPTGDNEVAAEYDELGSLLDRVAHDRLETQRGTLEGGAGRSGSRDDSGWITVTRQLRWAPWHRIATSDVDLSLSRPGTYTEHQLQTRIGCHDQFECHQVDLVDQGSAWVGENDAGSFAVGYVQPDGEIATIVVDTEDPDLAASDVAIDITVDEAIGFVTDDRLDL